MVCDIDDISAEYKRGAVEYWRSADGRLSTLLIVLKKPSGTLGPRVKETMFTANNFIMASKSDSRTDHCLDIIQRNRPDSAQDILLTIPAGTTGKIYWTDLHIERSDFQLKALPFNFLAA